MATDHPILEKSGFNKDKKLKIVGTNPVKHDGIDKVTGRAKFGADLFLPGNVCETTHAVIDRFAPTVAGVPYTFSYPSWLGDLTAAGFDAHEIFGFSTSLTYSHAAWRGRIRASARIVLMSDPASIAEFDAGGG